MIQDLILLGVVRLRDAEADMNLWVFNYLGPRFMAKILRGM